MCICMCYVLLMIQVHTTNVTAEISNIINHGYFVVELWGHHGAGFCDQDNDNEDQSRYI